MQSLEFKRLSVDGYVIALEPPMVREQINESITVSFANQEKCDMPISPIKKVAMVKIYHDRIVIILNDGQFDEYIFYQVFKSGKGEILIESTNQRDAWYLQWRISSTALVRYTVTNAGTNNERWQDEEAIIFTGIERGFEEVLLIKSNPEQMSDLYDLIPHYARHYSRLLQTDRDD